jgi:predicted nucleic acid-binding protein
MLFHKLIISDTSCLVNLEKIDAIHLLEQVFKKVIMFPIELVESFEQFTATVKNLMNKNIEKQGDL